MKRPGYFAVSRAIFDHPILAKPRSRRYSRTEAFEWLLSHAAWKPCGKRTPHGVVHMERGQLAITEREMAGAWRWPKTTVHRFLRLLNADGMIALELARCGPKNGPENRPQSGYALSLITICNYDKHQPVGKERFGNADQKVDQKSDRVLPQLPGLIYAIASQPDKTIESESLRVGGTINKRRPRHGQPWRDLMWCHYEADEWKAFAADYAAVRGVALLPARYLDGWGNWFVAQGEAFRRRYGRSRR